MSSSVELHRKLDRIEARLHAENEARKLDSPTIDFRLDSPKTPRQRPDIRGLHRSCDRNEKMDRSRLECRLDSPKHRPRHPDLNLCTGNGSTQRMERPRIDFQLGSPKTQRQRPDLNICSGNDSNRRMERPRIDFQLGSPKTQRQRPELPGLRPCIGNDSIRRMIDRSNFKLDSPTKTVKKQLNFRLDTPIAHRGWPEQSLRTDSNDGSRMHKPRIDFKLDSPKTHRPRPELFLKKDGGTSPSRGGHKAKPLFRSKPGSRVSIDNREIDRKLQEIMKATGKLMINGRYYKITEESMVLLGELGLGSCGHVVRMRHKETGSIVAVKQMRRSANKEENKRILMDLEVVLKSHKCPYIVQCLGAIVTPREVWICMEQMATCLEKLMKRSKQPIPEQIIGKMVVAIVKALNYLKEEHGLMHRDVKPSNMLLDEKGTVKLCDFGISGRLVDSKARTRSAGCAAYMAPERIDPPDPDNPDYDVRADVWSLGLSLVELATGEFPYKNCSNDFEVLARVLQEDPPRLPPKRGFSVDFHAFIQCCLTKDCHKRPKYKQLMDHSFFKRYELAKVDVATWFAMVMDKINSQSPSPKTSPGAAQLGPPTT